MSTALFFQAGFGGFLQGLPCRESFPEQMNPEAHRGERGSCGEKWNHNEKGEWITCPVISLASLLLQFGISSLISIVLPTSLTNTGETMAY